MKTCTKCGLPKVAEQFYRGRGECKACSLDAVRQWRVANPNFQDRYKREVQCPSCGEVRKVRSDKIKRKGFTGRCNPCQRAINGLSNFSHKLPVLRESFDLTLTLRWREAQERLCTPPRRMDWWQFFVAGACARCGGYFVAVASSHETAPRYCSLSCARRNNSKGRKRPKVKPHERRRVFERDRWICGICKKRVSRAKQWPEPRSAVVDHIVPLVAGEEFGGVHRMHNWQCAHADCNARKAAEYVQAAMF